MVDRILIVDDAPNIVLSLQFLLQKEGFEVAVAHNGGEALQRAAEFSPHLVVLDVMLPVMDGFEVCRQLRAGTGRSKAKILLLTARGRPAELQRGIEEGADAYMTKPFATRDLVAKVKQPLSERSGDDAGSAHQIIE
ncbi:MAG: response regulator receiver [Betaproteobacteria bacterium]|nr:response regulator receiver [Betaproteobacteria bacterium]